MLFRKPRNPIARLAAMTCLALIAGPPCASAAQPPTPETAPTTGGATPPPAAEAAQAPRLEIVNFAPARAYFVGSETVTVVATIRNSGTAPSPVGAAVAHLYCPAGLDYTGGDPAPKLPELAPGAATTFRWRLQPTTSEGSLVAALALETDGAAPLVSVIPVPHFAEPLPPNRSYAVKTPTARGGETQGVIENERVRARVLLSGSVPVIAFAVRIGAGWRHVGLTMPIAQLMSAEGGQQPWWEGFRVDSMASVSGKEQARLALSGGFGLRWRATLELTLRKGSAVVDVALKASPLRSVRVAGLRLTPLLAGDGSFGANVTEGLAPEPAGGGLVAAVRSDTVTFGQAWQTDPLFSDWTATPLSDVQGADYHLIGGEMRASAAPTQLDPGALLEAKTRIFVFSPSLSVADAHKVTIPARTRSAAIP